MAHPTKSLVALAGENDWHCAALFCRLGVVHFYRMPEARYMASGVTGHMTLTEQLMVAHAKREQRKSDAFKAKVLGRKG